MPTEEDARKAKAERIKKQIEDLINPPDTDEKQGEDSPQMQPGESPRDYIRRRMSGIDRGRPREE